MSALQISNNSAIGGGMTLMQGVGNSERCEYGNLASQVYGVHGNPNPNSSTTGLQRANALMKCHSIPR